MDAGKSLWWRFALTPATVYALLTVPASMNAASHYVRSGASGDGSDWGNAYGVLPAELTRGDTFYSADGSYGEYTFNDTGRQVITIRKATSAVHGTDAGWQESYGDGVAERPHGTGRASR